MKKIVSLLIILLCFMAFNVKADDNYEMYVPNCIIGVDKDVYIPIEFSIRNEKTFDSAINGTLPLFNIRDTAECTIDSFESNIFSDIKKDDSNSVYGVFKSEYSDGGILEETYQSAYVDGIFDYSKFSTSLVLRCTRNENLDESNYYVLNDDFNHIVVGDELYCSYANNLFDKGYTFTTVEGGNTTFSDVLVEGVETASENPDILYLVLLVTLTLLFFFILLEVRRQNKTIKKRK